MATTVLCPTCSRILPPERLAEHDCPHGKPCGSEDCTECAVATGSDRPDPMNFRARVKDES